MALGNLAQRFLVAAVAAPLLIFVLYLPRHEPTWALVLAATVLAMMEFFAMTLADRRDRIMSVIAGAASCAALYWLHKGVLPAQLGAAVGTTGPLFALVLAVLVPALYYLFRFRDMTTVAGRMSASIAGTVYVGLLLTFLALLKRDAAGSRGGDVVLMVLLLAWVGDTGAYFAGKFLGKARLYEAVSPKKTWAGAFGGLAGSLLAVALMKHFRMDYLTWVDVVLIAIPGGILGQMGDLVESLFKRSVGVKDSGALLPGHGGMLDRIDAVLFIAPYVYIYPIVRDLVLSL
jgi:phosphatidate cytidylyltransferase